MSSTSTAPAHPSTAGARFDRAIQWLLIVALVFMPAAFGVVHAWSELVVVVLCAAMLVLLAARLMVDRGRPLRWTWAYVPIALFVALVFVQLTPLPQGLLGLVSPHTAEFKSGLWADGEPGRWSVSFYPHATWHDLRLVAAMATVFVVVFNVFDSAHRVRWLLRMVAYVGGAVAAFALLQWQLGNGKIYWSVDTPLPARSGPFINYNNFGQYMILTMGAAVAVILAELQRNTFPTHSGRLRVRWSTIPPDRKQRVIAMAMIVGVAALGLANAGSRGALVAMVLAGVCTLVIARYGRRRRRWVGSLWGFAIIGLVAVGCLTLDLLYDRFESVGLREGRLTIVRDLMNLFVDFPLLGVGLGNHEMVYPAYQTLRTSATAIHADSDYPQLLAETGLIGLAIALAFIGCVVHAAVRTLNRSRNATATALIGLSFALVGVMIHSLVDFGQRLPANATLTAVVCGLILSIARLPDDRDPSVVADHVPADRAGGDRLRRWGGLGLLALLGLLYSVGLPQAVAAFTGERHWQMAQRFNDRIEASPPGPRSAHVELLAAAEAAVDVQPRRADYRYRLNFYRWRALQLSLAAEQRADVPAGRRDEARAIADGLRLLRRFCPTHGRAVALEGTIRMAIGQRDHGIELVEMAHGLRPNDPQIAFFAAAIAAEQGHADRALELFQQAVAIDERLYNRAIGLLLDRVGRTELAYRLADGDHRRLMSFAGLLRQRGGHDQMADDSYERAVRILRRRCDAGVASAAELSQLAAICADRGDHEDAVDYYRRAIDRQYDNIAWRIERARSLIALGRFRDAEQALQSCLRLQHTHDEARRLLRQVSVMVESAPAGDAAPPTPQPTPATSGAGE